MQRERLVGVGVGLMMAGSSKGRELFEVLAEQRARGKVIFGDAAAATASTSKPLTAAIPRVTTPRTGREIVVGTEAAFVIFVAVIAFVATAYMIGFRQGENDLAQGNPKAIDRPIFSPDADALKKLTGASHLEPLTKLNPARYTLRLRASSNGRKSGVHRLLRDRAHLQRILTAENLPHKVYIFNKAGVFWICVGVFASPNAPTLLRLKARLTKEAGSTGSAEPTPYAGCGASTIGTLGERWW